MSSQSISRRVLRRTATSAAAVTLALGLTVVLTTTPAAASGTYTGRAYVYGEDSFSGDWNDEGVVNVETHRSSNVACLWQSILWADGYLPKSGIDGIFGDQTDAATKRYQADKGLAPDGSVGRLTFAKAGQKIRAGDIFPDGYRYGTYYGSHQYFTIRRLPDAGNWMFVSPGGVFVSAAYNWKTC